MWTAETLGTTVQAFARLSQTLAVGNLTGDGPDDLAVAAPGQNAGGASQAGVVFVVPGSGVSNDALCQVCDGGGLVPSAAQVLDQESVGTRRETGDRFGGSVASRSAATMTAGDMDGDGQDDLFIGSPQEDGAGADTGLVSIRYGIGVGTIDLVPEQSSLRQGAETSFEFTWTHPECWCDLETIHFRLADDERVLFWARFDVASGLLTMLDSERSLGRREETPGGRGVLRSRDMLLNLERAELETSGPEGRTVTFRLPLRLVSDVPPGAYRVELLATDVHGNSQGFDQAGTLVVAGAGGH